MLVDRQHGGIERQAMSEASPLLGLADNNSWRLIAAHALLRTARR
ncbi:hypothetical protein [Acuticoccus kandeliae]|nr:hypothetical protein [Acuticoccus kandeliae]